MGKEWWLRQQSIVNQKAIFFRSSGIRLQKEDWDKLLKKFGFETSNSRKLQKAWFNKAKGVYRQPEWRLFQLGTSVKIPSFDLDESSAKSNSWEETSRRTG